MQPDPSGLSSANTNQPETLNRYSYTSNDPINFIDPTGLDEIPHIGLVLRLITEEYHRHFYGGSVGGGPGPLLEIGNESGGEGGGGEGPDFIEIVKWLLAMKDAIDGAVSKLTDPTSPCSQLFGTTTESLGFYSPGLFAQAMFNSGLIQIGTSFRNNGGTGSSPFAGTNTAAVTSYATGRLQLPSGGQVSGNGISVNANSFFMTGQLADGRQVNTLPNAGFYGLSLPNIRIAVIIHELLHSMGAIPQDGQGQRTPDDRSQSEANSEAVRNACFS